MSNGLDNLPDDPAELKRLLLEKDAILRERQEQLAASEARNEQIKREAAEQCQKESSF